MAYMLYVYHIISYIFFIFYIILGTYKTVDTYKNMFKIICEKCNELGLIFTPNS